MLRVLRTDTASGRRAVELLLASRTAPDFSALRDALPIVEDVLENGEKALRRYVRDLDAAGPELVHLRVSVSSLPGETAAPEFVKAFRLAVARVKAYHGRQKPKGFRFTDAAGVSFMEEPVPHEAVGVYVPGGRAFYPSSLLMGVVPAKVAGARRVVVATPPRAFEESAELRWALQELKVDEVLLAGGAHGIAGLVRVCGCTKIVGPGNRWVAAAKHLVSGLVSIDLPAGPSEVLVLASAGAEPNRIAADLLAQAEHDPFALCYLLTDSAELAEKTRAEVLRQVESLSTRETAQEALIRGRALVFPSLGEAAAVTREVAPEHLQLMGAAAERLAERLAATAGAVFVGNDTPTAFGDYLAGPNHVLPTGGAAKSFSGLSTRDFYRWGRTVSMSRPAARKLSRPAATLARFEGLDAHARALELRGER